MCKVIEEMRKEEREEGRMEGRAEGRAEGREEGRAEVLKASVQRMLSAGKYAMDEIAAVLGLSPDEVKKLAAEQST